MENKAYQAWVDFYMSFADRLRGFSDARSELIKKIKAVYTSVGMKLPTLEKDGKVTDIDPFTVFGLFNKGITNANRITLIRGFAKEFTIKAKTPENFDGIPVLNNKSATYYRFIGERGEQDIDVLWDVFMSALDYASGHSEADRAKFIASYDSAIVQKGVKWNLTMGLYWIRPYEYINLDSRSRWFITDRANMPESFLSTIGNLDAMPSAEKYLEIIAAGKQALEQGGYKYKNFPELSYYAWKISEEVNQQERIARGSVGDAIGDKDVDIVHYWVYSPGYGSAKWDEFYNEGIMAIARDYLGDLSKFPSRTAIRQQMEKLGTDSGTTNYKYASLEAWQFVHELKEGDIVFAKYGRGTIIGRGVVVSDYIYDDNREDEYKNIRRVKWTHKGNWPHPGAAITKVLTDVTPYTEYVEKLCALFESDVDNVEANNEEPVKQENLSVYTPKDFLAEVYMGEDDYRTLSNLLMKKKNLILQGAPGTGKTFAAKRLAYSIMGVKDPERVKMVQFHQSYSYEDFIMGFRPSASGFELKKGPFYSFCKTAEEDSENPYFFIIDEINRGNLSKIFGELFMLIENDKRGVALQLLYSDELFSVPENLYIIGMMNTADRSLAMLDYALRRRFAFYEFRPAFRSDGFRKYQHEKSNVKFDRLITAVERLNDAIIGDDTLGKGFCIGHSYFCTKDIIDDQWLDSVISYEILPLLSEYWFDEPAKVKDWERILREAIR